VGDGKDGEDGKDGKDVGDMNGGGHDTATRLGNKATSSKSKRSSPTKGSQHMTDMGGDAALHMAFALLSVHGVRSVTSVEDIPGEVLDLGSLLVTLDIPVDLIMTPANDFCGKGGTGKILNARQRRTLRRSQERAWKELEALKGKQAADGKALPVRRAYSPTCLNYGVNPGRIGRVQWVRHGATRHGPHALPGRWSRCLCRSGRLPDVWARPSTDGHLCAGTRRWTSPRPPVLRPQSHPRPLSRAADSDTEQICREVSAPDKRELTGFRKTT
jgi:hypothetical protein